MTVRPQAAHVLKAITGTAAQPKRSPAAPRALAAHVQKAIAGTATQPKRGPVTPRAVAAHVQAVLASATRGGVFQATPRAGVVQRMDYEHYEPASEDIDWEIYEQDEHGALVPREPEGGWEAHGKWLEAQHAQHMEDEELQRLHQEHLAEQRARDEHEAPSVDEMIALEEAHLKDLAAPYVVDAQGYPPQFEEAVRSVAWLMYQGIGNARQLLVNFCTEMKARNYAHANGYLFQIQQTMALLQKGYRVLQVEPSLYELIGENRFGDTLVVDPNTGRRIIVEIKNWTGYLKGAPKKGSIEDRNAREKERGGMRDQLLAQLERYLRTGQHVLFIWKGQLPIDVTFALNAIRDESGGRFRYRTAS